MSEYKYGIEPGDRLFDKLYNQIGVVYKVDEFSIQVSFPENITNFGGRLRYCRAYEFGKFHKIANRVKLINDLGEEIELPIFKSKPK